MAYFWHLLLLVAYLSIFNAFVLGYTYFCELNCGKKHTACMYEPCPPPQGFEQTFRMMQLEDKDRDNILFFHNEFRQFRATRWKIKNMQVMSYDLELEFVAQCWANSCRKRKDECRSTSQFRYVGQNAFYLTSSENVTKYELMEQAFYKWTSAILPSAIITSYEPNEKYDSLAQILWDATAALGCGCAYFGHLTLYMLICNYAPFVEDNQMPVFEYGTMLCSECTCNDKFSSLCGKIMDYHDSDFIPPFNLADDALDVSKKEYYLNILLLILTLLCK